MLELLHKWYGSQVERQGSAKPLRAGSIPARTSLVFKKILFFYL